MGGVVFARLHLDRQNGKAVVVIYQEVHLALLLVVVIEKRMPVCQQLGGDNGLIQRAEIDAELVVLYSSYIMPAKDKRQQPHDEKIERHHTHSRRD